MSGKTRAASRLAAANGGDHPRATSPVASTSSSGDPSSSSAPSASSSTLQTASTSVSHFQQNPRKRSCQPLKKRSYCHPHHSTAGQGRHRKRWRKVRIDVSLI